MELDRKAFHFDLDNKSVERFYTGKKNPWSDIQDFLESHCFEKPQYSGYESAENIVMSYQRAYGTVDKMMDKFPWFHRCVKAATFIWERLRSVKITTLSDRTLGAELGRLSESSWNATDSSIPSIPGMSR